MEPVRLDTLAPRIEELSLTGASVMMRGYEPFRHPDLVGIVQALAASNSTSKVRRIGMRTDATALVSLRDAQGCIDNGVRVFEVPLLPREMDVLSQEAPLDARLAGIQGIRNAAANLGLDTFVCADIFVCTHTAAYFSLVVQAAIAVGVDAVRVSFDGTDSVPALEALGGISVLDSMHALATQNSLAFFGDGQNGHMARYLKGAVLYRTVAAGTDAEVNDSGDNSDSD